MQIMILGLPHTPHKNCVQSAQPSPALRGIDSFSRGSECGGSPTPAQHGERALLKITMRDLECEYSLKKTLSER
jgi:hypothetical protein